MRELPQEFPLLMTNAKEEIFMNTGFKMLSSLRAMKPDPIVQMNPETAARLGLKEGDEVIIESKHGAIRQRLALEPALDPRVVNASFGWWFPEDAGDYGRERSNINMLTYDEGPHDPAAGCMQIRGVPCRVRSP